MNIRRVLLDVDKAIVRPSVVPAPGWLSVAAGILALGALGAGIGHATSISQTSWSVGLAGAGLILAGLGVVLHVT